MKNVIRTLIITALFCAPQTGYSMQPEINQKPSFVKTALQYAGKGLRFGVKGADRIVGNGINVLTIGGGLAAGALQVLASYENEKKYPQAARVRDILFQSKIVPFEKGEKEPLQDMMQKLCNTMGIKQHVELRNTIGKNRYAVAGCSDQIFIGRDFLKLPQDQQEEILAHELSHIKYKDPMYQSLFQAGSTLLAMKYYKKGSNLIDAACNFYLKKPYVMNSQISYKSLLYGKKIGALTFGSVLAQTTFNLLATTKYKRFCEKRADIKAVKATNNAQAGIDFFEDCKDKYGNIEGGFFGSHPSLSERIAYLKPYTQPQSVAPEREYNDLAISC